MTAVPAVTPVTKPVPKPTVAFVLLLVHVPPATGCDSVVLPPTHIVYVPVTGAGAGKTVTVIVAEQPALSA